MLIIYGQEAKFEKEFDEMVANQPVLLVIHSPTCGACIKLLPELAEFEEKLKLTILDNELGVFL
jgi:thioredoxin-like negative regulator of GroEL